jgi:hypothetical protein
LKIAPKRRIKSLLRKILPKNFRIFLWRLIPRIQRINTYLLKEPQLTKTLSPIDPKFIIRQTDLTDLETLKETYADRGPEMFKNKIPPRLNSPHWVGLAVVDSTSGDIAYIAWIVTKSIEYFREFNINLKDGQFFLKDGYCSTRYRHQGLHTRMEQERINYCIQNGAHQIFIQIMNANEKGKQSVLNNGYDFYQSNLILSFPVFKIYREFYSVLKNPFKKIVK